MGLWTLVVIQFLFAAVVARLAGLLGLVTVQGLEWRKALAFFPAASMFMITIVAGNAVMNYSNVNTFLVLRAVCPIPCGLLELFIYGDRCPPVFSWVSMLVTLFGSYMYAQAVGGIRLESVAWSAIYLVMMPIDGVLIKHTISASELSKWGLVYYNNLL